MSIETKTENRAEDRRFVDPEAEIILFSREDVITTSGDISDTIPDDDDQHATPWI